MHARPGLASLRTPTPVCPDEHGCCRGPDKLAHMCDGISRHTTSLDDSTAAGPEPVVVLAERVDPARNQWGFCTSSIYAGRMAAS